ncbi:MAG: ABC-F family ATP-binding cassette domain-containing protein [Crocinitomicaceae bacterium]|nr:ABC-F family ATP-binding cassette domain-containing protein [Crocinitomicaceae bacterium]
MIIVENMSLHLPQGFLYEDVSLQIKAGEKIGLVGKNGAGKSTFLKLISGGAKPTSGKIHLGKDQHLGFLSQDIEVYSEKSVFDFIKDSNEQLNKLFSRIEEINEELEIREDYESDSYSNIIAELSECHEKLNHLGVETWEKDIEQTLFGLGFKREDFQKKTNELSGGWKMRAELARILINQPDILLLDEPTNHLDIVTIQWLETYLKTYKGILILISHDRLFLDNVTTRTIEIINAKVKDYPFPYSKYKVIREEELQNLTSQKKNQEKEIKHTEELINKFRAKKNKAAFAQSLIKKLEKTERIEVESDHVRQASIKFPISRESGKKVLEVDVQSKEYGDKKILDQLEFILTKGQKIALLGANGTGKSTLIKCIMGETSYNGNIELGHNVEIGYFAQDSSKHLSPSDSVFEVIDHVAVGEKRKEIRSLLGAFLFSGEDIDKKVSVLSGGEKTRLGLCKLLFSDSNFLILDEPTNHLDIQSKNVLKNALQNYAGTFIIVSHDREFLEGLFDEIWEIQDGRLKVHYSGIKEFLATKSSEIEQQSSNPVKKEVQKQEVSSFQQAKDQKKIKNKIRNLEQSIEKLESEIEETRSALYLEENVSNVSKLSELDEKINSLEKELESKMAEWEEQSSLLD